MDPILFIHGIAGDAKQYQPIIKYLKSKGFDKFYEFTYESRIGLSPIKEIAKDFADFINENVKEPKINIISFSQGGIIALTYLKFFKNKKVDKLFTICSPHKGSQLAYLLNLPGFIDLRPGSALLKELEDFTKGNEIRIYSLYTPLDLMVFPGWNAILRNGHTKMILSPSHTSAFFWPSTKKFIYKNLI